MRRSCSRYLPITYCVQRSCEVQNITTSLRFPRTASKQFYSSYQQISTLVSRSEYILTFLQLECAVGRRVSFVALTLDLHYITLLQPRLMHYH